MFDANVRKYSTDIDQNEIDGLLAMLDTQEDEERQDREIRALLDSNPPSSKPDVSRVRADPDKRHEYRISKVSARVDTLKLKRPKTDNLHNFAKNVQRLDRKCATTYDEIEEPDIVRVEDPSVKLVRGVSTLPRCIERLPVAGVDIAVDVFVEPNTLVNREAAVGRILDSWDRITPYGVMSPFVQYRDHCSYYSGKETDPVRAHCYHKHLDRIGRRTGQGTPLPESKCSARFEIRFQGAGLAYFDLRAILSGQSSLYCQARPFFTFVHSEIDLKVKRALDNLSRKWTNA